MKARPGIVLMVIVVGVLCVGSAAMATDYDWDATGASTSWLSEINWHLDDGYPDDDTDDANIISGGNLCTFDPGSDVEIDQLFLAGSSPTKRKLHVKDGSLTVDMLDLQDYAELDVDADFTIGNGTGLSGAVWIDVADNVTFLARNVSCWCSGISIESSQARLNLTTGSAATFETRGISINADLANDVRSLKVTGGTIAMTSLSTMLIKSDPDADNKRAKFWLASGDIDFGTGCWIQLKGGGSNARRAELDLDQDLTLDTNGFTHITGYVTIDIAAGKTFRSSVTSVDGFSGGPAVLTVTSGSGAIMNTQDVTLE